ncbi:BLUF domain-containing protein [Acinetobacter puyangensis]|nr:BLUF domain-containing protein [Acinetobacter puyangensis]
MKARLCYSSRRNEDENLIEDIIDILTVARKFNSENKIYGVLYYADNSFFQCLEGNKSDIESLFESIKKDPRHHSLKHLETTHIEKFSFKKWSMKYVDKNSDIDMFFKKNGSEKFDPQVLDLKILPLFLENLICVNQKESSSRLKKGIFNRGITPIF